MKKKHLVLLIILLILASIIWVLWGQYYKNINEPRQLTWLVIVWENCIYYKDKCYNNCIEEHKNSPITYNWFCKEECCLLNQNELSNIIYIIIFVFILFLIVFLLKKEKHDK